MIGINIGSQNTKFSAGNLICVKDVYSAYDFKMNQTLNDYVDRFILSIVQFKEDNILIGESTKLGYKKYNLSTFENLSRLIGFRYDLGINKEEHKYLYSNKNYIKEENKFKFNLKNIEYSITGDYLVYAFINEVHKKIQYKLKTNETQKFIFSTPDYYTLYQKQSLKNILKALNIIQDNNNDLPIINESTALTMYYGYLNYNELTDENQYIIFVDIGHSKTSFILSEFSRKKFSVKCVENIPFLGGRDINNELFELCLNEFKKQNNIELKVTGRNKIRLLEEIEKAKKTLTINSEASINVDAIQNEIDFSFEITKEKFEDIIRNFVSQIKIKLTIFLMKIKKYKPNKIEMAGQLLRIPIIQKIIKETVKMPISKTIAMDECHSLGSLLYGIFISRKKKFEELETVDSYNNYTISVEINKIINRHFIWDIIPYKNAILVTKKKKENDIDKSLKIKTFYSKYNFKDFDWGDNYDIYYYSFKKIFENKKVLFIDYKIDDSNKFDFSYNNDSFTKDDKGILSLSENKKFINDIKNSSLVEIKS